jgi:uncharacterized protein YqeY
MITPTINNQIAQALKVHDEIRLSTLRLLSSAFNYERIAKQHELSEDEEQEVVRREAKKRRDAIEIYTKVNQHERAAKEQKELEILEEYLPKQMGDEELATIVESTIQDMGVTSIGNMGKVIGAVKQKMGNNADGGRIAALVKSKLQ